MKEIIDRYKVEKVLSEYSLLNIAEGVKDISENIGYYRENTDAATKELNTTKEWEVIMKRLE